MSKRTRLGREQVIDLLQTGGIIRISPSCRARFHNMADPCTVDIRTFNRLLRSGALERFNCDDLPSHSWKFYRLKRQNPKSHT